VRATTTITQTPFAHLGCAHDVDEALDEPPVGAVDELVELNEALGAGESRSLNESIATRSISSARSPISPQDIGERGIGLDVGDELRELRDGGRSRRRCARAGD
jgi:hypothetical protein